MKLPSPARGSVRFRPARNDWMYVIDVGPRDQRRQITRVGFATQDEAEEAAIRHWTTTQDSGPTYAKSAIYRRAAADMLSEDLAEFEFPTEGPGFVYFIRAGRYLKIGYSNDPERRLIEVRSTGPLVVPADLDRATAELWMYCLGGPEDEKQIQWVARNYRVCGEWFWAADPLLRGLEMLASKGTSVRAAA